MKLWFLLIYNFIVLYENNRNIDILNQSPVFITSIWDYFSGLLNGFLTSLLIFLLFLWGFLLASDSFNISCNEKIYHKIPIFSSWNLSSQDLNLSCQHPKNHSDSFWYSVIAWDDNINEIKWGVSVAKSNCGNVDVWSLNDGLSVVLWISNDQKSWLLEFFSQLIGKCTRNPSWWWAGSASGVLTKFINSSLTVLFSTNYDDFRQIRNRGNHSCSKFDFLISLINPENVVAWTVFFLDKLFHVVINLVGTEMNLNLWWDIR